MESNKRLSPSKRGYNRRWQQYRLLFLAENPFCAYHLQRDELVAASVVDHITPHRGDNTLFWEPTNHQALCESCHNSVKQQEEHHGLRRGADAAGNPLDARHHWNI